MKIVIPALGLQRNGGNRVLFAIVNALSRSDVDCEFLVPGGCDQPGFALDTRVRITAITRPRRSKPLRWLLFVLALVPRLRRNQVLANHFLTAVAATLALGLFSKRYVYLVQDLEYRFYRPPLAWLAWGLCRLTWRTGRVVPANPYLAHQLKARGVDAEPALALGVASEFLDTARSADADIDVLMMLRRGRHKRLDRYQQLALQLRQRGLTTAALAPAEELFQPFGNALTTTLVPRNDADIITMMDRCRVFVLASEHEGFALPPLEAMARGLAVVVFPCGGPSVYVRDRVNALIVHDSSVRTAADLIEEALARPDLRKQLGRGGRETAERFSLARAAPQAAQSLKRLFRAGPHRPGRA